MRKLFRERKKGKILMTILLLFNDLKYGKCSLLCCNGYRHALFIIIFCRYIRKALTKEKREEKNINGGNKNFI
jgi:hypothetical protein